jgi:hypothetical protein
METQDHLKNAVEEVEFYKTELDRERRAYENVYVEFFFSERKLEN